MNTKLAMGLFLAGSVLAMPAWASVTFTDNTFDLSNYIYTLGKPGTEVSQNPTGGPDGSPALSIVRPSSNSIGEFQRDYFINSSFAYDPTVSGAIQAINYSQEYSAKLQTIAQTNFAITTNLLILQNNKYYVYAENQQLPFFHANAGWQTAQRNGLTAGLFQLIDIVNYTFDPTQHPDFTNGAMKFGMMDGYLATDRFPVSISQSSAWDNLSITVNSVATVPLPAGVWLFGSALLGVLGLKRKNTVG